MIAIKEFLLAQCIAYVHQRVSRIQERISGIEHSLTSETKSSAGDKHETGRAMLQLEREKSGAQLAEAQKLLEIVAKVNTSAATKVSLGSLVITSQANYYISISMGKITHEETDYFAIAANSPIGKLMLGKAKSDSFIFNSNSILIDEVY